MPFDCLPLDLDAGCLGHLARNLCDDRFELALGHLAELLRGVSAVRQVSRRQRDRCHERLELERQLPGPDRPDRRFSKVRLFEGPAERLLRLGRAVDSNYDAHARSLWAAVSLPGSIGERPQPGSVRARMPSRDRPASMVSRTMIVVGVDGSEASRAALRWALEEARLRGAKLRAVYAWIAPQIGGRGYIPPELLDPELLRRTAQERLDALVSDVAGDSSGAELEAVVGQGTAAKVLLDAACDAELLVVGSRGHGGFAGLLLGSVSQHCAHHSSCPVVIVRGRAHPQEER